MDYLYVTIIAFIGSFIQSTSGFGFAAFCMALWPLVIPFRQAVAMEVITAFVMVAYLSIRLFRHINFKLLLFPFLSSIVFSSLGVFLLLTGAETVLRRILGLALVLLAVYFIFFNGVFKIKPTKVNGLIAGGASGLLAGLFAIGGPPIVIYLMSATDDKMTYNATLQSFFFFTSIPIFIMHLAMGNVTGTTMAYSGIALIGVLAGSVVGLHFFRKLPMNAVRKAASGLMAVIGIYLTIKG